eukprot:CAMPEP_0116867180 /NCGR_PEP_ID=MMETSP0418-20121206/26471_1 /TAXON_ID=1158023 /ORGANISM="Astrosyne radiata, Strain 13vi08-1A" /LENGTH=323 /DNA_ID=CAMNT_0004502957 /DNA_START=166 /DNA_END=1137 /DNA_ORIENTATION=-
MADWEAERGKKVHWQEMCAFMDQELKATCDGDTSRLVQKYAPDLLPGMTGALTHGIIHLGWGIDAQNPWMIVEGLAYLNFCYVGVDPSKITIREVGDEAPMDTVMRLSNEFYEKNLAETWIAAVKSKYDESFHPELVPAGFQWHLAKIVHEAHPIATQVPSWLRDTDLDTLFEQMYRATTYIYLATRDSSDGHGSFLILHALTSLWGVEHVCKAIQDDDVTRSALQQFFCMIVCLLATSNIGFPTAKILKEAITEFPPDKVVEVDWTPLEARGIAEEEEHNIKLVYVMRECWKRYGKWSGFSEAAASFTLTPNIGPANTSFKA